MTDQQTDQQNDQQNNQQEFQQTLKTQVMTMQIIVASLLLGTLVFGGFALTNANPPQANQPAKNLSLLALLFAIVCIALSAAVPRMIARGQIKAISLGRWLPQPRARLQQWNSDEGKLLMVYQTKLIIGCALLEGPAFFTWMAYWTEQQTWTIGVAVTLMVLLVLHFPRRAAVEQWVEIQARELREQRWLAAKG